MFTRTTNRLLDIIQMVAERIDILVDRADRQDKRIDSLQEQIIELMINPETRKGHIPWT